MFNFSDSDLCVRACQPRPALGYITQLQREALATYYGSEALKPYIKPFSKKEDSEKLEWRRDMTVDSYENYVEEISSTYVEQVYKNTVSRTCKEPQLDRYFATTYKEWIERDVAPMALILPELFIFFELPADATPPKTMLQQIETRLWPRPCLTMPDQVVNYQCDIDGELLWISRKMCVHVGDAEEEYIEVRDEVNVYTLTMDGKPVPRLRLPSGELVTAAPHKLNGVPAIRMKWKDNHERRKALGVAFLYPVVKKSLATLQFASMLVEAGYFHLNLQLVAGPKTIEETVKKGGTGNSKVIPKIAGEDPPFYLQKPSMEISTLVKLVYEIMPQTIYRSARLRDRTTKRELSGVAMAQQAIPEVASLGRVAAFLQQADLRCMTVIALGYDPSINTEDISASYPSRFDGKTTAEHLADVTVFTNAQATGDAPSSPTALVELMFDAIQSALPDRDPATMAKIRKELEAAAARELAEESAAEGEASGTAESDTPEEVQTEGDAADAGGEPARPESEQPKSEAAPSASQPKASATKPAPKFRSRKAKVGA